LASRSTVPTVRYASARPQHPDADLRNLNDVEMAPLSYIGAMPRGCGMAARVQQQPPPLPEEFQPTSPPLSRFRIVPPPPMRPTLFPDEARFAMRLSVLVGCTELAAWAWFARAGAQGALLGWAFARLLRPVWSLAGTRLPRPAVALALLFLGLAGTAASLLTDHALVAVGLIAAGLAAVADLSASCAADSITVERRSTAYAWLDMASGLGGAIGLALGSSYGGVAGAVGAAALVFACVGVPDLRDRGTPRSTWTADAYIQVLRSPFGSQIVALAFFGAFLGMQPPSRAIPDWLVLLLPLAGMAISARAEPHMPNAVLLPRIALGAAAAGLFVPGLGLLAMGVLFAALPASVARGAGEMERPVASSLAWSALALGAAVGAVL